MRIFVSECELRNWPKDRRIKVEGDVEVNFLTDSELLALKQEYFEAGRSGINHGRDGFWFNYTDLKGYEAEREADNKQPGNGGEGG